MAAPSSLVLTLDAALPGCSAGVVRDGVVLSMRVADGARGNLATLPAMVAAVLEQAGTSATALSLVAVTVGPGSFAGLRTALALAHGIGLAAGVPLAGVTVGEALFDPGEPRAQWAAVDTRRGRVFLECGGEVRAAALDDIPAPPGPLVVGGDAAAAVVDRLRARGFDVALGPVLPTPAGIALAALRRAATGLPARPAQPLYVDPPEARPVNAA